MHDQIEGLTKSQNCWRRAEQVKAASSRATESLARTLQGAGYAVDGRDEGAPIGYATLPIGFVKQFERS